jgi:putative ABC transport system permease protein
MVQSRLFLRIISKNREIYFLKTITLSIAFACSVLISLFSFNEFGYDRFHYKSEEIFRVIQRNNQDNHSGNRLSTKIPWSVFESLSKSTDSLTVARVKILNSVSVVSRGQYRHDQKIHAVDSTLLSIFTFTILDGSLENFQVDEPTLLLSEKMSNQYFGSTQSAGKILKMFTLKDTVTCKVAAVFRDFPGNAHEEFNVLTGFNTNVLTTLKFNESDFGIYGRVQLGTLEKQEVLLNQKLVENSCTYSLQPLPAIYFGPRIIGEDSRHGDEYSIWILLCITALILFLALSTFVNLTTLTLPHRAKELAIKKLSGTSQLMVMLSFARESFALVGISVLISLLLLISVNSFIEPILLINVKHLIFHGEQSLILLIVVLILISGAAPLIMVYKFARATPTRLLSTDTISFPRFKRVITFIQLGISIFLIVASMVIRRQVNYSLLKEPGRNHYQVVYLNFPADYTNESLWELRAHWKRNNPNIEAVMATSQLPNHIQSKEMDSENYFMAVDRGFLEFFDLQLLHGRWFQVNDEPPLSVVNKASPQHTLDDKIIGVVENMGSQLNQPEKPIKYLVANSTHYHFLCVRILEVNIRRTVSYLSTFFTSPDNPVQVTFMNKRFEEWIHYQDRLNKLSELLAIMSAILSCFAIYGLSLSLVRDKLKQIAIHKLYGASALMITKLLAKDFAKQMGIAILIFGPFTYIFLNEFLRNFVYATSFEWMDSIYPLSYCLVVIIVLCGFQAFSLNRADLTGALKG